MAEEEKPRKNLSLAGQIGIALIAAAIAGLALQGNADITTEYIKPFGTIFLNLLKFIVVPVVIFSMISGIISMSDIRKVGSIGTAGVPGAGMVMLTMILASVGLPVEGIALVAGVGRIFDMGRTVVNITGDASCALIAFNPERKREELKAAKAA